MQCYTVALHKRLVSAPVHAGQGHYNDIAHDLDRTGASILTDALRKIRLVMQAKILQ